MLSVRGALWVCREAYDLVSFLTLPGDLLTLHSFSPQTRRWDGPASQGAALLGLKCHGFFSRISLS